jgi:hypothetical protein
VNVKPIKKIPRAIKFLLPKIGINFGINGLLKITANEYVENI